MVRHAHHDKIGTGNVRTFRSRTFRFWMALLKTASRPNRPDLHPLRAGIAGLGDGQKVSYDLENGRDGRESAINLQLV